MALTTVASKTKNIPIRDIDTTPKAPALSKSFNIRDVGDLLGGKDMFHELHRHNFFYLLALEKGRGDHAIDFTTYDVGDHSLFFIRPGQVHQLTLQAGSTGYLVVFTPDFYYPHDKTSNPLLRQVSNTNHYPLDSERFKKIFSILNNTFQEYTDKQERYQDVIKANLGILFIELARQNSKIRGSDGATYAEERLAEFLSLLETHIIHHKQVAQYADMLHLSPYQLNAITKATLGKTCSVLIDEYIILESKRYLLATANQVNQIANVLGYEDTSYFIRFFKKHTGYSPEAFRHNFR